jgi:saccharopine dehydrogenase (NAD+, L-lysine-forming)
MRDGAPVRARAALGHEDGYDLTAIPVVSMVEQLLDGSARIPGVRLMGMATDPQRLLDDCAEMGAWVEVDGPE